MKEGDYSLQYPGIQHRTCGTYCDHDDIESEFCNAGTDEDAGMRKS